MPRRLPAIREYFDKDRYGWADLGGCRMRYLRAGSGLPLLLVHGLFGYSFSWRFNLNALAQHRTVYALDLPGVGFSERSPNVDCSFEGLAAILLCFMENQAIPAADVLGTSHGGAVAMMLAAQAPHRIRRLVLVAPVHPWSGSHDLLPRVLATTPGALLFRALATPALGFLHRRVLQRMYGDPRRIAPGTLEGYSAPLGISGTTQHLLRVMHTWGRDLRELETMLPRIAGIPTLLVWGDRDRAVSHTTAPRLGQVFKQPQVVILSGAGHLPYEELPEEFNCTVEKFLVTQQV